VAQDFSKKLYRSAAWQKCRAAYIKSVFYRCELCGQPGDILHHAITLTPQNIDDPNITLNWEHLIFLCIRCHNQTHSDSLPTRGDVKFDEQGNLIKRM